MKKRPNFPRILIISILLCWLIGLPYIIWATDRHVVDTAMMGAFGLAVIGGLIGCFAFAAINRSRKNSR